MIVRKILKVKTTGSRGEGNLRPELADRLPSGINLAVLEYSEDDSFAILEIWGSTHPLIEHSISSKSLDDTVKEPSIIEVLEKHPKSPKILGTMSIASSATLDIDSSTKTITDKARGKSDTYVRKEIDRDGEIFILDEG